MFADFSQVAKIVVAWRLAAACQQYSWLHSFKEDLNLNTFKQRNVSPVSHNLHHSLLYYSALLTVPQGTLMSVIYADPGFCSSLCSSSLAGSLLLGQLSREIGYKVGPERLKDT